jgi:hypothetical protein
MAVMVVVSEVASGTAVGAGLVIRYDTVAYRYGMSRALLVIPAIYALVDSLKVRVGRRFRREPATAASPVGEPAAGG